MRATCDLRSEVENWVKLGSRVACPSTIREHATHCVSCSDFIADVERVRKAFGETTERELSEWRHVQVRNRLVALASAQGQRPNTTRTQLKWAMVAASILVVTASTFAALKKGPLSKNQASVTPTAEVTLVDSAIGHTVQAGPNEVYELIQGLGEFSVKHLGPNQRFRVVVGPDEVEVRGTRFQVVARKRQLHSVKVLEGHVQVTHSGQSVQLDPGQQWVSELPTTTDVQAEQPSGSARSSDFTSTAPNFAPRRSAPESSATAGSSSELHDAAFKAALARLRAGDATAALADFDEILRTGPLDAGRRADVLYWSAVASRRSGNSAATERRLRQCLTEQPNGWHAPEAALMLGEILMARGESLLARPWLERAANSNRPNTSNKAREMLVKSGKN